MVSQRQRFPRKRYKEEHPGLFPTSEPTPPKDLSKRKKKNNKFKRKKPESNDPNKPEKSSYKKHPLRVAGIKPGESCYICKTSDHIAKTCPKKSEREGNKICLFCRERDHSLKNCPNKNDERVLLQLHHVCRRRCRPAVGNIFRHVAVHAHRQREHLVPIYLDLPRVARSVAGLAAICCLNSRSSSPSFLRFRHLPTTQLPPPPPVYSYRQDVHFCRRSSRFCRHSRRIVDENRHFGPFSVAKPAKGSLVVVFGPGAIGLGTVEGAIWGRMEEVTEQGSLMASNGRGVVAERLAELEDPIEGEGHLLQSYKEQKSESSMEIKELHARSHHILEIFNGEGLSPMLVLYLFSSVQGFMLRSSLPLADIPSNIY
ncbi:hypothetical protein Salat_0603100 [Sesamum alatum]|uniref:CCHC-type domain-containing protein n=1 Tax=Sesamum alatum TaxID=300844 RepID=A0AAE2CTZ6_9LAMI|nr:hypothetical protein Salat_0603100 [Sesamum alatum]